MATFERVRLTQLNIKKYLYEKFGYDADIKLMGEKRLKDVPILLQDDYGEDNDCTLTSITCAIKRLNRTMSENEIYDTVEKVAKKYFYNGKLYGTIPLFIKSIWDEANRKCNCKLLTGWRVFKGLGFNQNSIKELLDKERLVILSLHSDGRNYYKDHTITVFGYNLYEINGKEKVFLAVYDNWYRSVSYIDYDELSIISSINY